METINAQEVKEIIEKVNHVEIEDVMFCKSLVLEKYRDSGIDGLMFFEEKNGVSLYVDMIATSEDHNIHLCAALPNSLNVYELILKK